MRDGERNNILHHPVMLKEVLQYLNPTSGEVVVDCTIGGAGHAEEILKRIMPEGILIGIDRDAEALDIARQRLNKYKGVFRLVQGNFRNIGVILKDLHISRVDGFLFDLGLSSYQLQDAQRGFSFRMDGPLDMRMDRTQKLTAKDILNHLTPTQLERIFRDYGEEHFAKRIAQHICFKRKGNPLQTTAELTQIILHSIPARYQSRHIHPATRIFQALRIAVNNELDSLSFALESILPYLSGGRRIAVVSFHSLEDRIVKNKFRQFSKENYFNVITKKPVTPSEAEVLFNPRARSAKLRAGEKL
jgi:16S rRNA (cytosine1402-N4)-methyltransferase